MRTKQAITSRYFVLDDDEWRELSPEERSAARKAMLRHLGAEQDDLGAAFEELRREREALEAGEREAEQLMDADCDGWTKRGRVGGLSVGEGIDRRRRGSA